MRVALDVTASLVGDTGSARYVRELSAALERHDVEFLRFAIGRGRNAAASDVRRLRVPMRVVHRAWPLLRAPRAEWLAPGCDLVHVPDLVPPPTRLPLVVTVFDVDAIELPDRHPPRATRIQHAQVSAARDRATVVITISEATADGLRRHGVDGERIVVTPLGVTSLPPPEMSCVPDAPYVLVVGGLAARKGQRELVDAYAHATMGDVRLVLAGPDGWRADDVRRAIDAHGLVDRVVCTGGVSDAQLAGLYSSCLAVCVPSLGEGFGMPVLEAAAAGAAVVASDLPVLREIEGAVTLFARPGDRAKWVCALERIVEDDTLLQDSRAHCQAFARQFTWDATATLTAAAYRRAVSV